jgi:hypothetical protein
MDKPLYNDSGIEIKKVYTADSSSYHPLSELPGEFPFTRGVQARHVPRQAMDYATVCGIQHSRRK